MSEKKLLENVSVTVSIPVGDRDWLVRLAELTGHLRTHPATGEVGGNLSWAIQEAVAFLRNHRATYVRESTGVLDELGAGDE